MLQSSVDLPLLWSDRDFFGSRACLIKYVYIEVPGGDHVTVITHSPQNITKIFDQARRR
jgi:hypothetical protein